MARLGALTAAVLTACAAVAVCGAAAPRRDAALADGALAPAMSFAEVEGSSAPLPFPPASDSDPVLQNMANVLTWLVQGKVSLPEMERILGVVNSNVRVEQNRADHKARLRKSRCSETVSSYDEQIAEAEKLVEDAKEVLQHRKHEVLAIRVGLRDNKRRSDKLQAQQDNLAERISEVQAHRVSEVQSSLKSYQTVTRSMEGVRAAKELVNTASNRASDAAGFATGVAMGGSSDEEQQEAEEAHSFSIAGADDEVAMLEVNSRSRRRQAAGLLGPDDAAEGESEEQGEDEAERATHRADGNWRAFVGARMTAENVVDSLSTLGTDLERSFEDTIKDAKAAPGTFAVTERDLRQQHGNLAHALRGLESEAADVQISLVHAQQGVGDAQQEVLDREVDVKNLKQFRDSTGATCRRDAAMFAEDRAHRERVLGVVSDLQQVLRQVKVGRWPESLASIERELRAAGYKEPGQLPALSRDCTYTTQKGDSLAAIADKFGVDHDAVTDANPSLGGAGEYPPTGYRVRVPELHMDKAARAMCVWRPHLATPAPKVPVVQSEKDRDLAAVHTVRVDNTGRVVVHRASRDAVQAAEAAEEAKLVSDDGKAPSVSGLSLTGGQYVDAGHAGYTAVANRTAEGGITVEMWVKVRSAPDAMRTAGLISAVAESPVNPVTLERDAKGPYAHGWMLGVRRATVGCHPRLRFVWGAKGARGLARMEFVESASLSHVDQWYHVAATYNASASPSGAHVMKLYVNGKLRGVSSAQWGELSYDAPDASVNRTALLFMARDEVDSRYATDGEAADVTLWSRALATDEIARHAAERNALREAASADGARGLVLRVPLRDVAAAVAADDKDGDVGGMVSSGDEVPFAAAPTALGSARVASGLGPFSPITDAQALKRKEAACASQSPQRDDKMTASLKPLERAISALEKKAKMADAAEDEMRSAERGIAAADTRIAQLVDEQAHFNEVMGQKASMVGAATVSLAGARQRGDDARVAELQTLIMRSKAERQAAKRSLATAREKVDKVRGARALHQQALDAAAALRRSATRAARALPALRAGVNGIVRAETEEDVAREAVQDWKQLATSSRAQVAEAKARLEEAKQLGDRGQMTVALTEATSAEGRAVKAEVMAQRASAELATAVEANRIAHEVLRLPKWIFARSQEAERKVARAEALDESADAVDEEMEAQEEVEHPATGATGAFDATIKAAGLGEWSVDAQAIKLAKGAASLAGESEEEEEEEEEGDEQSSDDRVARSNATMTHMEEVARNMSRQADAIKEGGATGAAALEGKPLPAEVEKQRPASAKEVAAAQEEADKEVETEKQWGNAEEVERERGELVKLSDEAETLEAMVDRLEDQGLGDQAADARKDLSAKRRKMQVIKDKIKRLAANMAANAEEAEEKEEDSGVAHEGDGSDAQEGAEDDAASFRLRGTGVTVEEGPTAAPAVTTSSQAPVATPSQGADASACGSNVVLSEFAGAEASRQLADGVVAAAQVVTFDADATVGSVALQLKSADGWPHIASLKVFRTAAADEGQGPSGEPLTVMASSSPVEKEGWYAFAPEDGSLSAKAGDRWMLVLGDAPQVAWSSGVATPGAAPRAGPALVNTATGWAPVNEHSDAETPTEVLSYRLVTC